MKNPCPCCGYLTFGLDFPGSFDICDVCRWEDDDVQYNDPDYSGGANVPSLNQARKNFLEFGAKSKESIKRVRPPLPEEYPPSPAKLNNAT